MVTALSFGAWLKQQRQARDLTQDGLAEQIGCAVDTIRKLEAGRRRPSRAFAELLTTLLDVPLPARAAFVDWARGSSPPPALDADQAPLPAARVALTPPPAPLPLPPTTFVGREAEVQQICALLWRASTRLVTLAGPPGIGKTRLALAVAGMVQDDFADGIVFVPLSVLTDAAAVPDAIARRIGVPEAASRSVMAGLQECLQDRQFLLVLDNFEQVVEAGAVIADLIAAAPRLKVLVTSRTVLHLRGEKEFAVPPLGWPPLGPTAPLAKLGTYPAIRLFVERAQDVQPDFALTEVNAPIVAAICARLDGLPLAIELAAARSKILPPAAILSRLGPGAGRGALPLLTGGAQDLPTRQQTLRDAIAWSYDLLSPPAQAVFRALGVFVGGFTLEAAAAVAGAQLDDVAALVDQSLLRPHSGSVLPGASEPRFAMLETIREYALDRLASHDEIGAARRRHASYFLAFAQAAAAELAGPTQESWLTRMEVEHDNLRAVFDWAAGEEKVEVGLRLGGALWRFWEVRGHWSEGQARLTALLAQAGARQAPASAIGPALYTLGHLTWRLGEYTAAHERLVESLALARAADDDALAARALFSIGRVALDRFDYPPAREYITASLALAQAQGDPAGIGAALHALGVLATLEADYPAAQTFYAESLALRRMLGDTRGITQTLANLGNVAGRQGDFPTAGVLYEQALVQARELGDQMMIGHALQQLVFVARWAEDYSRARLLSDEVVALRRVLGNRRELAGSLQSHAHLALLAGDLAAADASLTESLALARAVGNRWGEVLCLLSLSIRRALSGQPVEATRLYGALAAELAATGRHFQLLEERDYTRAVDAVRALLDEATFAAAWAAGQALTLEQALGAATAPLP